VVSTCTSFNLSSRNNLRKSSPSTLLQISLKNSQMDSIFWSRHQMVRMLELVWMKWRANFILICQANVKHRHLQELSKSLIWQARSISTRYQLHLAMRLELPLLVTQLQWAWVQLHRNRLIVSQLRHVWVIKPMDQLKDNKDGHTFFMNCWRTTIKLMNTQLWTTVCHLVASCLRVIQNHSTKIADTSN